MTAIGVDTHKASLAACAVDERGAALAEMTFANHRAGHAALAAWATGLDPAAVIGIEGSATYGAALARFLDAAGQPVREVPPHLTRRERIGTRRPGKSDPGDALAIARVTLREPSLPPVRRADATRELQLLVEAREDLVAEMTRTRNRLHADLLVLLPGTTGSLVGPRALSTLARRLRRCSGLQAELARQRLRDLRRLTAAADRLETRIATRVAGHPLLEIPGVGALIAAKLLGEVGDVGRFRSDDAFAALAGVAPRPAQARCSACVSTAAAIASSTGRCIWRRWCSCATTRRRRPSWPASGPRARASARPFAASSATWRGLCSGPCSSVLRAWRWRLDKIGAWQSGLPNQVTR